MTTGQFKLTVYVPESHLAQVKQALFDAGAGRIGNYQHCCWQTLGTGQYMPILSANPFIGELNTLTQLAEWKLEVLLPSELRAAVTDALQRSHPYETPAFDFIALA